ncbi:MAG: sugar-binding domain-containing protein, partial [Segetibacter sp.]
MIASKKIIVFILMILSMSAKAQPAYVSLAGEWHFKIDSSGEGESAAWYNNPSSFFALKIKLPGTMDDAGYGTPVSIQSETDKHQINKEVLLHLWRKVSYIGAAWYQKEIVIPAEWKNKHIELFLERVLWETNVWVDGKEINKTGESLIAPQTFDLSAFLTPGKHTITLRIDNSKKYDISLGDRDFAHIYTNETQIIWNGVIGKIGLEAKSKTYFDNVQVYDANANAKYINVKAALNNQTEKSFKSNIELSVEKGGINYGSLNTTVSLEPGKNEFNFKIDITKPIKNWDEFDPSLYNLKSKISSGKDYDLNDCSFGFRTVSNKDANLRINNRLLF